MNISLETPAGLYGPTVSLEEFVAVDDDSGDENEMKNAAHVFVPTFFEVRNTMKVQGSNRLVFHSTGTSRTPGSRTAVHILMGEKGKKMSGAS
ncbi:hypothetical protein TNCV_5009151 [Trichonephila clavipes]|nr:hypothetical protein TNCV_5009151 [Trichonephila clavipes]